MSRARKPDPLSIEEYLTGELNSPVKHEYLGGFVYAMAGARNTHNVIATNALAILWVQLRGTPCRPFNSDTKIRLRMSSDTRFYYPDVSVVCRQNPGDDSFQDEPAVVLEVLSQDTRRIDEGEKKDAYLTIPSLLVYVTVEQNTPALTAWRRTEHGFVPEVHRGLDAVLPLSEIGARLPLAELYESVDFDRLEQEP